MPYNINNRNNTQSHTILDNTTDESVSSIHYAGLYSKDIEPLIAESFLWITEKFSSSSVDIYNGPTLVVEAEASPVNPVVGQMWYDYGVGELKYYDGIANGWISLTSLLSGVSTQHIDDTRGNVNALTFNPHALDKNSIGLGNVDNVPAYDKVENFSEYQQFILDSSGNPTATINPKYDASLSLSAVHTNLDVLSKSAQYTKVAASALFLSDTGTASDTNAVNGVASSSLMLSASPTITSGIAASSTTTSQIEAANSLMTLQSGTSGDSLTCAMNAATGGSSFKADTSNTSAEFTVSLLDGTGTETDRMKLTSTGLTVGLTDNVVFHVGNPMTAVQIGALDITGIAANTLQLDNSAENVIVSSNTIVKRNSLGQIVADVINVDTPLVNEALNVGDTLLYKEDTSTSGSIVQTSTSNMTTWLGAAAVVQNTGAKAWARFNSTLSSVVSVGCVVTLVSPGEYTITLTGTAPASFTPIVSPVDDGDITPALDSLNNGTTLDAAAAWVTVTGSNTMSIKTKMYKGDKVLLPNATAPTTGFNTFESPVYTASTYTVSIYY